MSDGGINPGMNPGVPMGPQGEAPGATSAMVLGILGFLCCQLLAPVALFKGKGVMKTVDESGGTLGGRGKGQVGFILGILGTLGLVLWIVLAATGNVHFSGSTSVS